MVGYLPPEAYGQQGRLPTVDLYGLAATYVKLRTGREPFGQTLEEVVDRQRAGQPELEGLAVWEAEAVRQALAPCPEERPQRGACAWVKQLYRLSDEREADLPGVSKVGQTFRTTWSRSIPAALLRPTTSRKLPAKAGIPRMTRLGKESSS